MADKVEAVKKVAETLKEVDRIAPNKEQFDTLMNSPKFAAEHMEIQPFAEISELKNQPVFAEEKVSSQRSSTDQEGREKQKQTEEIEGIEEKQSTSSSPSLSQDVANLDKDVSHLNPENIKEKSKTVIGQIENLKNQLTQTKSEIKPSYQTLLKNRLSHIDDHLKIALNKAGLEYTPPPIEVKQNSNPVHKFIGFLSNSQNQLNNLNISIDQLSASGQISPADMLTIQMKMGYVQQQIELFTSLLNKALESTKTIMNVQV